MKEVTVQHEHQNPAATIGFVIHYPFQFYVYKNIFEQLRGKAEFVIDMYRPHPPEVERSIQQGITELLDKHKMPYRIVRREDYMFTRYINKFYARYKGLVSVWEIGCMTHPATHAIKKINLTYGAGKDLTMVRPQRGIHDLILSYGPRDTKLFSLFTHTVMVGNPKYDDWFNDTVDATDVARIRNTLDPKKQTILYLPTHSDLSSVDQLSDGLVELSDEYNVLVKLHYYMTREEPERVQKISRGNIILFDDAMDLLPLLKVADMVISDNSSAIFDAVLTDKPLLVADFLDEEFLNEQHKEPELLNRGVRGALTYSESIEQLVKKYGWVETLRHGDNLRKRVQDTLNDAEYFQKKRKDLRDDLFAFNDGKCALRAARAIEECIASTAPTTRGVIHHAFEAYKRTINILSYDKERRMRREIELYKRIAQEHVREYGKAVFSVILIKDDNGTIDLEMGIRSVLNCDFPVEKFEVIILGLSKDEEVRAIKLCASEEYAGLQVRFVEVREGLATAIRHAIGIARGEYIAFTTTACKIPSRWLTVFLGAFTRHPVISGVGGYVAPHPTMPDPVSLYELFILEKQLSVDRERVPENSLYEIVSRTWASNPAGLIENVCYRKEAISALRGHVYTLFDLEIALKRSATESGTMCFIPEPVEYKYFRNEHVLARRARLRSFAYGVVRNELQKAWALVPEHARVTMRDIVRTAFVLRNPQLLRAIVVGAFNARIGALYARLRLLRARVLREAADTRYASTRR